MTWRICVCFTAYCEHCADQACVDCPANWVWQGPSETSQTRPDEADIDSDVTCVAGDGSSSAASIVDRGPMPASGLVKISPEAAQARRLEWRSSMKANLERRRASGRTERRDQIKDGTRPRRERGREGNIRIITTNPNCANRVKEELLLGKTFKEADYLLVQETKVTGEGKDQFTNWCRKSGWDPIVDEGYIKYKKRGGGTSVLARGEGIRPLAAEEGEHKGRLTLAMTDIEGGAVLGSIYCIAGQAAPRQLRLFRRLAQRLMAIGLHFIIGGDWQLSPREVEATGLPGLLDAVIVSPKSMTNRTSGNEIDYFMISRGLLQDKTYNVYTCVDCAFDPHLPVILDLPTVRRKLTSYRISQPKLLPIYPVVGPARAEVDEIIDWGAWQAGKDLMNLVKPCEETLTRAAETWAAGAETEIMAKLGIHGDERIPYAGIGLKPVVVQDHADRRFKTVADELGLTGHWLAWATKGLRAITLLAATDRDGHLFEDRKDYVQRMSRRAPSLKKRFEKLRPREGEEDVREVTGRCLTELARAGRWSRNLPPLTLRIHSPGAQDSVRRIDSLADEAGQALESLANRRRSDTRKKLRTWAKGADQRTAHAVTKNSEAITLKTACSSKAHAGELTNQEAADAGLREMTSTWKGNDRDGGDDIAAMAEALYAVAKKEDDLEELLLPPLCPKRVRHIASRFRGATGVSCDFLRPSHIGLVSDSCCTALVTFLHAVERLRRWPTLLRTVIEIAIGKKAGGSRLIGLATAVYRVWTKTRYADCRMALESRVRRPFLPAAPGRGALAAAFDIAYDAEVAHSRGQAVATTSFDLRQYYEQITMEEVAVGCRRFGVPQPIAVLVLHLYSGPRRIRVGRACSAAVFPRRSILAGCTFALLVVRLITVVPIELLLNLIKKRFSGWDAWATMVMYVDDGIISTYGAPDAVALLHVWVTRMVFAWVKEVLRKETAEGKSQCIVSSRVLLDSLKDDMRAMGIPTSMEGELLGIDYSAGGNLRRRPTQVKRRAKASRRKGRLRWWKGLGGNARRVAKDGAQPTLAYGASVVGLTNAGMRDARSILAATTTVRCSGASTAAKLAVGGDRYEDIDPAISLCDLPIEGVLRKLWDHPPSRRDFVRVWLTARREVQEAPASRRWFNLHGPVGAAWAHLLRIEADWPRPFVLSALDHEVDILTTPPKQVVAIIKAHARRREDIALLRRLAAQRQWDVEAVLTRYKHGIDWNLVRALLIGKDGTLDAAQRRALEVVVCGGFWPEARRYHAGMRSSAECEACKMGEATHAHRLHLCSAMAADQSLARAAGNLPRLPREAAKAEYAPLYEMGLPPKATIWAPIECEFEEGALDMAVSGETLYGDGSGFNQSEVEDRVATWAVIRAVKDDSGSWDVAEGLRGLVTGWFPTVPRAELTALLKHLQHKGTGNAFVSDCRYVVDGANLGIPTTLTNSSNVNADLWKKALALQRDAGGAITIIKTKAHRSRSAAQLDRDDGIDFWHGNNLADEAAKDLARQAAAARPNHSPNSASREMVVATIKCVAFGAVWAFRHWPDTRDASTRKRADDETERDEAEEGHILRRRPDGAVECISCRKMASGKRAVQKLHTETCGGAVALRCDESHDLRETNGITWCARCGGYMSRWPRLLLKPCRNKPASQAARNVLRRLTMGLPPTTAAYLEQVAKDNGAPAGSTSVPDARDAHGALVHEVRRHHQPMSTDADDFTEGTGSKAVASQSSPRAPTPGIYGRLPAYRRAPVPSSFSTSTIADPVRDVGSADPRARDHRPAALASSVGSPRPSTATSSTAASARRASSAAAPFDSEEALASSRVSGRLRCQRLSTSAWTRGVAIGRLNLGITCGVEGCTRITKARCKSCHRGICIPCAKSGAQCSESA